MTTTGQSLEDLRAAVDAVDAQIIELLKQRLKLTSRMTGVKEHAGMMLRDEQREHLVLNRLLELNQHSEPRLPQKQLAEVYSTIMNWSLKAQEELAQGQSSSRSQ